MSRAQVLKGIVTTGIVPVIRTRSADLALRAAAALREGGIDVLEVTMTVPDAVTAIEALAKRLSGAAWIGAGSVLDADMARRCLDAGAQFLVAPGFDPHVVEAGHAADVAVIPGALTATEVLAARAAGADMIKIFPCSAVGGARYVRALRAPIPDVALLPTGGISLDSVAGYFAAGASAIGVGGELVDEALLGAGDDRKLVERARQFVAAVRIARHAR
jgi:2-dehydro-3-deoxyphosphogluconate aldolase/(4S)-4-hydroxy-2-oxoglutarate aldolase